MAYCYSVRDEVERKTNGHLINLNTIPYKNFIVDYKEEKHGQVLVVILRHKFSGDSIYVSQFEFIVRVCKYKADIDMMDIYMNHIIHYFWNRYTKVKFNKAPTTVGNYNPLAYNPEGEPNVSIGAVQQYAKHHAEILLTKLNTVCHCKFELVIHNVWYGVTVKFIAPTEAETLSIAHVFTCDLISNVNNMIKTMDSIYKRNQ